MGEDWTEEMEKAWYELWNKSFAVLMESVEGAAKYAKTMQDIWAIAKSRTTSQAFGILMRKNLLMGTQWVVTMSHVGSLIAPFRQIRLLQAKLSHEFFHREFTEIMKMDTHCLLLNLQRSFESNTRCFLSKFAITGTYTH